MAMNKKETGAIAELKDSVGEFRRHMGVLVEGLHSEFRVVAEQYGSVVKKLEEHDRRFDKIDLRFDRIDLEFSGMKTGLFDTSHRVEDHETRIRKLELTGR